MRALRVPEADPNLLRADAPLSDALAVADRAVGGVLGVIDRHGQRVGHISGIEVAAWLRRGGNLADRVAEAMTTARLDGPGKRIPVAEPALLGRELEYVTECVTTNWISSQGAFVKRFEAMLGELVGARHVVSCCNGTAALHLALLGQRIGPGDEVIVPDLTFAATINTVVHAGATPVIVDVDRRSWNIDPALVAAAITPRTRAIMPVHLYGQPAAMDALMELAERHGLAVIEDAAEAIGAKHRGKPCGTIGHAGTFSFFSNKVVTTGEGGAVVFHDEAAALRARRMRDHGMSPAKRYWHEEVGYNYRLTNLQAAIGCAQLEQFPNFIARKLAIAARYRERLKNLPGFELATEFEGMSNSYWMISTIIDPARSGVTRDEVMSRLAEAAIETRPLFYPLHEMPPYKAFAGNRRFPHTDELSARGMSLPSGITLTDPDIDRICTTIERIVTARQLLRRIGR
jgi:perosamine synthetase